MSYVFISYSRQDQAYVEYLALAMSQRGLNTWFDVDTEGGERWWRKISQKIEGCAAFVVVMSPDAEASAWVEHEVMFAESEEKPIIALLLDGDEFGMLINMHYYDVRDGGLPDEDAFDRLASFLPRVESEEDTLLLDPALVAEVLAQTNRPDSLWYSQEHIWVRQLANEVATIGITDYGLQSLGEVMQIDVVALGTNLRPGSVFAMIETEKVASDLFSPIHGPVIQVNRLLTRRPRLINADPYGMGWLLQMGLTIPPDLMTAAEYAAFCETQ